MAKEQGHTMQAVARRTGLSPPAAILGEKRCSRHALRLLVGQGAWGILNGTKEAEQECRSRCPKQA
jgi:hypothetical protein